jgi:hypothetical protein
VVIQFFVEKEREPARGQLAGKKISTICAFLVGNVLNVKELDDKTVL